MTDRDRPAGSSRTSDAHAYTVKVLVISPAAAAPVKGALGGGEDGGWGRPSSWRPGCRGCWASSL